MASTPGPQPTSRLRPTPAISCWRSGGRPDLRSAIDAGIQWIIGQSPIDYHNAVVRANLPPDQADAAILASIERFRTYQVPGTWHVGPSMTPADLGARLVAHGFVDAGAEPGMAVDLHALHEDIATTSGW